ncbi:hypothetical protein CC2G_006517 [Coprinopsis cinerea AmutBmut pab1-1]|nr:hypothetical protein CC2G_006517 [Coprinopsis cinerea AmutBmut pab1-1]
MTRGRRAKGKLTFRKRSGPRARQSSKLANDDSSDDDATLAHSTPACSTSWHYDDDVDEHDEWEEDVEEVDQLLPSESDQVEVEEEFTIPMEVPSPCGNATRDLDGITSTTSFTSFLTDLALRMGCSVSHLMAVSIGYVPSWLPKNPKPKPKLLDDEQSWEKLVNVVRQFRDDAKAKKKGKGTIALTSSDIAFPRIVVLGIGKSSITRRTGSESKMHRAPGLSHLDHL